MITFASEHIQASLEVIVIEEGLDRLEMKLGILQLIDGLSYLHNSAKILHGNLTPNAIYITLSKHWKIAGFAFSVAANESNLFPCFPWTKKLPVHLQPDLDFLAPEYLLSNKNSVTSAADVFSLGVLICWICAGGKRLIDAKNNVDTYRVICGQLDTALKCIAEELGPNLLDAMEKVVNLDVDKRPTVQFLALIKYFDDPALSALHQLDDIMQVFDPEQKNVFLSQTLYDSLSIIPENLWFTRILPRFDEFFIDCYDLYAALSRPLFYMLDQCKNDNVNRLKVNPSILENMNVLFRRFSDNQEIIDEIQDLIVMFVKSQDVHIQRQLDFLACIGTLSDRCDSNVLNMLIAAIPMCVVQRILMRDATRLRDRAAICSYLLNPMTLGLALNDLKAAQFEDLINTVRILIDIIEHLRDVESDRESSHRSSFSSFGRMSSRRVSMSSSHLPLVMITAARPTCSGCRHDSR
ncbi:unnamed protein product [Acanthocheilonema viteae]|uniref:Protein kinase domain-containing protein n=1 Tax=Acanthocheilonema viteae TaxID=6277 RepID=A0A498SPP8_ACAVI|nr:unnamed protein product [Acanthocheilonema viteae]